jgi:hypothetical protein
MNSADIADYNVKWGVDIYITGNSTMVAARIFGSSGNKSIDHKTFCGRKISLGLAKGSLPLDLSIAGITTS